jgi:hypothetical protein
MIRPIKKCMDKMILLRKLHSTRIPDIHGKINVEFPGYIT